MVRSYPVLAPVREVKNNAVVTRHPLRMDFGRLRRHRCHGRHGYTGSNFRLYNWRSALDGILLARIRHMEFHVRLVFRERPSCGIRRSTEYLPAF